MIDREAGPAISDMAPAVAEPIELRYTTNAGGSCLARAPAGRLHIMSLRGALDELRHYSLSACP